MNTKNIRKTNLRRSVILFGLSMIFLVLPSNVQDELNSTSKKLPGEALSIRFEHLGLEDGLNQNSVYNITQDRQGYLWMVTQDGLHRYNGYDFKIYTFTPFDTTSITPGILTSMEETSEGNIWVTVDGHGLQNFDFLLKISVATFMILRIPQAFRLI